MIACIVVNYNDGIQTKTFIESVKDFRLIDYFVIVDNNSCDDSLNVLSSIKNDKVHLIKNDINGGYGLGNNTGINYAWNDLKCEYAIIANPDVSFNQDYIYNVCHLLQTHNNCLAASGIQLDINSNPIDQSAWYLPSPLELIFEHTLFLSRIIKKKKYDISKKICIVDCLAGALLMVNSELFLKIGGYDEKMFLYYEETLLGLKAKKHGYYSILNSEINYLHIHEKSINKSITNRVDKIKIMLNSKEYVLRNHMKANGVLIALNMLISRIIILETYLICFIKKVIE